MMMSRAYTRNNHGGDGSWQLNIDETYLNYSPGFSNASNGVVDRLWELNIDDTYFSYNDNGGGGGGGDDLEGDQYVMVLDGDGLEGDEYVMILNSSNPETHALETVLGTGVAYDPFFPNNTDDHHQSRNGLSEEMVSKYLDARSRRCDDKEIMKDDKAGEMCVVCQDELHGQEQQQQGRVAVARIGCGHEYHYDCIRQWLREKNLCPLCKAKVLSDQQENKLSL